MSILDNLRGASSLEDLAQMLGYKPSALAFLIFKLSSDKKYKKFYISKRNGGVREINAPTEPLKVLQRRLANILYACRAQIDAEIDMPSLSHGYRKDHSIVTNANGHKRRRYVLNLDLKNFFPSFNFGRVRGFFIRSRNFQLHEKVATITAQIAIHENMLPQGSPCSPIIADLIAQLLDLRLVTLAKRTRVHYSRYADDLTFSTSQKDFPSSLATQAPDTKWVLGEELIDRIEEAGFAINYAKVRMQCRTGRQLVHRSVQKIHPHNRQNA